MSDKMWKHLMLALFGAGYIVFVYVLIDWANCTASNPC